MVTIPATVTDLTSAFEGCTSLTEVKLEHSHQALIDGTVTMTDCFKGCSSLTKIICHNAPPIEESEYWHAYRITPDATNQQASVRVFDKDGKAVGNAINVAYNGGNQIVAKGKTNFVAFGNFDKTVSGVTTIDGYVMDMMSKHYPMSARQDTLNADKKNFVLWADDNGEEGGEEVTTNIFSGSITVSNAQHADEADHATTSDSATVADSISNSVKAYIRNQNVLSDLENIDIGKTSSTANTMEYDGFIYIVLRYENDGDTNRPRVYLNGVLISIAQAWTQYYTSNFDSVVIPVKKNDTIYITYRTPTVHQARFYKLRDYSDRS